ncbi:Carbonic anhydrase 2 [Trichoplax sp. H2]|uniref:Carbonic anhydrase n=1 Tax=Trichoplax adhaerens TaxID=10228 RepID=B3RJD2_TRIAD|nr:hypothetical protein TRIADDRAFT_18628 [Trichoplax adhaerens]EDV29312.1 hypothetical protein TRIADDRAFT_18628 [Trichoplax adhaerens]RDD42890.1 Carbonic anhydrase 2 [Trichoplax sp. H2]|eukprot:XP_002108514.1 hypothetical protein TRIADDRAFT_18628 [Trichoplax adhaerens]
MLGPEKWHNDYPLANGHYQSPIDIECSQQIFQQDLLDHPLKITYSPCSDSLLTNTGSSFMVALGQDCVIQDGPLSYEYELVQFHAHWGKEDYRGSEHTVNKTSHAMEIHLVHWNKTLYKNVTEAFSQPHGLAVIGVFTKIGSHHDKLQAIVDQLHKITHQNDEAVKISSFNPEDLLPNPQGRNAYWTYQGSLTTPPCTENVTWIVLRDPIEISSEQITAFRDLQSRDGKMMDNFRPVQSLNNRQIRSTFRP